MERKEFLAKFGIGLAAVCAGCTIASCGSGAKSGDPGPGNNNNPPPAGSGNLFSVDLGSDMKNVGDSKVSNGVILVRLASGNTASSFTAVQVACTHQGTSINYNTAQGIFICPNHGSEFNTSGAVIMGPAAAPLHQYNITVSGNQLIVSA